MGIKKDCSCGYWSHEQEECLYHGGKYCVHDEQTPTEDKFVGVSGKFVQSQIIKCTKINRFVDAEVDFWTDFFEQMLEDAGVEIDKK